MLGEVNRKMVSESIRTRIRTGLASTFGVRFKGAIIYGSEARGTAGPESDIDILVLLDGPVELGRDLRTIINTLYPLQLELERCIHAHPADALTFKAGEYSLYRNVQCEGIMV
jgi:predicted nucleotidyltransferase